MENVYSFHLQFNLFDVLMDLKLSSHHNQCVLYTGKGDPTKSFNERHAIHYLSIYDNKILRNFRCHSSDIIGVSMSPVDDCFLSCSKDRTVRLWNLQQAGSLAKMDFPQTGRMNIDPNGTPYASYDSTGLVFGVTTPLANDSGHVSTIYYASISSYITYYCINNCTVSTS